MKLFGNLAGGFAWGITLVGWASTYWVNCRLIKLMRDQQKFYDTLMADQRRFTADMFVAHSQAFTASVDDAPGGP